MLLSNHTSESLPESFLIANEVILLLIAVVGTLDNLLTFTAVIVYCYLHNPANIFIGNLSLNNGLYCAMIIPIRFATLVYRDWVWSETFCNFVGSLAHLLAGNTAILFAGIALNRLIHILHPDKYHVVYGRVSLALQVVLLWSFTIVTCLLFPMFGVWDAAFVYNEDTYSCTFDSDSGHGYKYFIISLGFTVPVAFVVVCYIVILVYYRAVQRKVNPLKIGLHSMNSNKQHRQCSQKKKMRMPRPAMQQQKAENEDQRKRTLTQATWPSVELRGSQGREYKRHTWPQTAQGGTTHSIHSSTQLRTVRFNISVRVQIDVEENKSGQRHPDDQAVPTIFNSKCAGLYPTTSTAGNGNATPTTGSCNHGTSGGCQAAKDATVQNKITEMPHQYGTPTNIDSGNLSVVMSPVPEKGTSSTQESRTAGPFPMPSEACSKIIMRARTLRQRHDAIKVAVMMVCCFIVTGICVIPYCVVQLVSDMINFPLAYMISIMLTSLSMCLNPVVYAMMNAQFRRAYKSLCFTVFCCRQRHASSRSSCCNSCCWKR